MDIWVSEYLQGKQFWEIGRKYNATPETVRNYLRDKVVFRKRGLKPGNVPWNQGLTAETSDSVARQAKSLSAIMTGRDGRKWSEEERLLHSARCKGKVGGLREGSGRTKSEFRLNLLGDSILCQSSYESYFLDLCNKSGLLAVRCPYVFDYYSSLDDAIRRYYPDFYLPEIDLIVEIKGYVTRRDLDKAKSVNRDFVMIKDGNELFSLSEDLKSELLRMVGRVV